MKEWVLEAKKNVEGLLKIVKDAGIKSNVINEWKDDYISFLEEFADYDEKQIVINSGLVKAGKSSLFNAILGDDIFDVDVIRATVDSEKYNADNFLFIDTPGLDANNKDSEIAYDTYKYADIILYSHDMTDGELTRIELNEIKTIGEIFGGVDKLFRSMIFVLTHASEKDEAQIKKIKEVVTKQLIDEFSIKASSEQIQPYAVIAVDSPSYLEGRKNNDIALIEYGNVDTVIEAVNAMFKNQETDGSSLFRQYAVNEINRWQEKLLSEIQKKTTKLEEFEDVKGDESIDIDKFIDFVKKEFSNLKDKLKENKYRLKEKEDSDSEIIIFGGWCEEEYSFRWSAKDNAVEVLENLILEAREEAMSRLNERYAECYSYIKQSSSAGILKDIEELMLKIKEQAFNLSLSLDIRDIPNIKDDDLTTQIDRFSSKYSENYLNNIHGPDYYKDSIKIDEFEHWESVKTLFGGYKDKTTKYYKWDLDRVKERAGNSMSFKFVLKYNNITNACNGIVDIYSEYYLEQLENVEEDILKQLKAKGSEQDKEVASKLSEKELLEFEIGVLSGIAIGNESIKERICIA